MVVSVTCVTSRVPVTSVVELRPDTPMPRMLTPPEREEVRVWLDVASCT